MGSIWVGGKQGWSSLDWDSQIGFHWDEENSWEQLVRLVTGLIHLDLWVNDSGPGGICEVPS